MEDDDEDIYAPHLEELNYLASTLLAMEENQRKRLRGESGDALRELAKIAESLRIRELTPAERVSIGNRLWNLKDVLGPSRFNWRTAKRPKGAKSRSTNPNVDLQIIAEARGFPAPDVPFGTTLANIVKRRMSAGELPKIEVASHIQRLRRLAKRSGLQPS